MFINDVDSLMKMGWKFSLNKAFSLSYHPEVLLEAAPREPSKVSKLLTCKEQQIMPQNIKI